MKKFLEYLQQTLASDPGLTAIIPSAQIGPSVRQNTKWPALEYGVDAFQEFPNGKEILALTLSVYSTSGALECSQVYDCLRDLMTALKLTPVGDAAQRTEGFSVDQIHMVHMDMLPIGQTEWARHMRVQYLVKMIRRLTGGPSQKQ